MGCRPPQVCEYSVRWYVLVYHDDSVAQMMSLMIHLTKRNSKASHQLRWVQQLLWLLR